MCGSYRGSGGDGLECGSVPDLHHTVVAGRVDQVVGVDQRVNDLFMTLWT